MSFIEYPVKGIDHHLLDVGLNGEPLHLRVTELAAHSASHPPHQHGGIEALYMLDGEGTVYFEDETYRLAPNQSIVFDPQKLHGIRNDSDQSIRYLVALVREKED